MHKTIVLLLLLPALAALASDPTPVSLVATDSNDALIAGLQSAGVLTRATAARVAMLNRAAPLLPQLRDALADAIARHGADAPDLYHAHLTKSRMTTRSDFFRQALWAHPELLPVTASRILGWRDADGWSGLLRTAFDSAVAVPAGPLTASVDMADAAIRDASIWYLVRGYAQDPAAIHDPLRAALLAPRAEAAADREDFGRELLRRMLGEERKDNERWLKFLRSQNRRSYFPRCCRRVSPMPS